MNGAILTAGIALFIQLGAAIWTASRLTEKVEGQSRWLKAMDERVDSHETRISHLEGALN